MNRFRAMGSTILSLSVLVMATSAMAQKPLKVTVRDVTHEFKSDPPPIFPTPAPKPNDPTGGDPSGDDPTGDIPTMPDPTTSEPDDGTYDTSVGTIGDLITLGGKIWDFIISAKPTADYKVLKGNVVPAEVTDWRQLTWKRNKMLTKVYRVEFFSPITKKSAGGFDYKINFIYGGSLHGKGAFIGQIAVTPGQVKLNTDRSLTFRAELLDPLNFGTEEDPVAGVQLSVTWSSPTTTRYSMNSAEYMLYGDGEFEALNTEVSGK